MTIEEATALCSGMFPDTIGVEFLTLEHGHTVVRMAAHRGLHAPNGYLHGGAVTSLADTACGFGAIATMDDDSMTFATLDLQCNFIGSTLEGTVTCEAHMAHGGRTTQVWDAVVRRDDGRDIALFRCTQLLMKKRPTA